MNFSTGTLHLDFDSDDEEAQYRATVLQAILRPNELVIQFRGHDSDEGEYHGMCTLIRNGNVFTGVGNFVSTHGKMSSTIRTTCVEETPEVLSLSGHWLDDGDRDPYDLEIELQK